MKISAITVSYNYSDTLSIIAKTNRHIFDEWIIVTLNDDEDTKNLCSAYNLTCIIDDGEFNKGRMTNKALQSLNNPDWILLLDADILLPFNTKKFLEGKRLHPKRIYGASRKILGKYKDFRMFYVGGDKTVLRNDLERKSIIGYFQLFHHNSIVGKQLLERSGAAHIDIEFSNRWPQMLQEILDLEVYHLGRTVKNWNGKKTKFFGPKIKRFKINDSI